MNTSLYRSFNGSGMLTLMHRLRKVGIVARPGALRMLGRRLGAASIRAPIARLARSRTAGALVLTYHRVIDVNGDPQLLRVTPQHFAEQLSVLRQHYRVVPLRTLLRRLGAGEEIAGTVALTFDDGYVDNLEVAQPLMERFETPATVFIASHYIGGNRGFWWDELEALLLDAEPIPQTLRLNIRGRRYEWDFADDCLYEPAQHKQHQQWHVELASAPTRRHRVYQRLHKLLYNLAPDERDAVLDKLRQWAARETCARASHRTLTAQELHTLAASPLIEIGAHTATHPALSMLSRSAQEVEIRGGKQRLEELIGRETTSFAYPYGSLSSFDEASVAIVKASGFVSAVTTFADSVRPGADPYALPRVLVRDYDGDQFHRFLRSWIGQ
jgi:peptidoglycan/xylan/chitin deacetylase (PgdA/CDA1 family)